MSCHVIGKEEKELERGHIIQVLSLILPVRSYDFYFCRDGCESTLTSITGPGPGGGIMIIKVNAELTMWYLYLLY